MVESCAPRVLMFVPQYPYPVVGGLERQSHELSKTLVNAFGVEVQVLSGKLFPEQAGFEYVDGVPVTRIHWSTWKPLRFIRTPFDVLIQLWRKRRTYDVIHLHQHSSVGLFVILLALILRKPILTKLPNVGELGIPGVQKQVMGAMRMAILRRSSAIVAMSKISIDELLSCNYERCRILTVPNGITRLSVSAEKSNGSGVNKFCRVIFIGRLSSEKNPTVLLQAWLKVQHSARAAARLELWGGGALENELKQLCNNLGLQESVLFCGHVDNVRERLRDVDLVVLPSLVEGNSNVILEAMEAGLPIVATPVGGTPMQVGAEGASLLVPVSDVDQLASRLALLIDNSELRKKYGAAMSQRVKNHFDIEVIATRYLCAYRKLVASNDFNMAECSQLPNTDQECAV